MKPPVSISLFGPSAIDALANFNTPLSRTIRFKKSSRNETVSIKLKSSEGEICLKIYRKKTKSPALQDC